MDSVTHTCAECGKTPEETEFRTTNTVQGERLRKYCKECSKARERRLDNKTVQPSTALVPSRVEIVQVNERPVSAVWVNEYQRYWPAKTAVEAVGLDWPAQYKRIQRDARLAQGIAMVTIPSAGGEQKTACLPWEAWHYFWTGVDELTVNAGAYPAVTRIKDEAYTALAAAFGDGPKTTMPVSAHAVSTDLASVNHRIDKMHGTVVTLDRKVDQLIEWSTEVDEVRRTITIRGSLYIARFASEEFTNPARVLQRYISDAPHWLARGYALCCIGKTTGDPRLRVRKHHGKLPTDLISVPICTMDVDDPDTGETYLRGNAPRFPVAHKVEKGKLKDWFWIKPEYLSKIPETWPKWATVTELVTACQGWRFAATVAGVEQTAWL